MSNPHVMLKTIEEYFKNMFRKQQIIIKDNGKCYDFTFKDSKFEEICEKIWKNFNYANVKRKSYLPYKKIGEDIYASKTLYLGKMILISNKGEIVKEYILDKNYTSFLTIKDSVNFHHVTVADFGFMDKSTMEKVMIDVNERIKLIKNIQKIKIVKIDHIGPNKNIEVVRVEFEDNECDKKLTEIWDKYDKEMKHMKGIITEPEWHITTKGAKFEGFVFGDKFEIKEIGPFDAFYVKKLE